MRIRWLLIILFVLLGSPDAGANDTVRSALQELAEFDKECRAIEPGDSHAVGCARASANSLLSRLKYVEKFDKRAAQAGRVRALALIRELEKKDTPGNLPVDIVAPPERENVPRPSSGRSSFDDATRKQLEEIKARYESLPEKLHAGDRLAFTLEHAMLLAKECDRFTRDFQRASRQWYTDKRIVRSMRTTTATESLRYRLESNLNWVVPDIMNTQLWRSRWYLEAACHGALRVAQKKIGPTPSIIIIIEDGGRDAIEWESGATIDDMLQFAQRAAMVGVVFEKRIGGDPSPWLKKKQEIEELAQSQGIQLKP